MKLRKNQFSSWHVNNDGSSTSWILPWTKTNAVNNIISLHCNGLFNQLHFKSCWFEQKKNWQKQIAKNCRSKQSDCRRALQVWNMRFKLHHELVILLSNSLTLCRQFFPPACKNRFVLVHWNSHKFRFKLSKCYNEIIDFHVIYDDMNNIFIRSIQLT